MLYPTSVTNIDVAKILLILTKMAGFNYFIIKFQEFAGSQIGAHQVKFSQSEV